MILKSKGKPEGGDSSIEADGSWFDAATMPIYALGSRYIHSPYSSSHGDACPEEDRPRPFAGRS